MILQNSWRFLFLTCHRKINSLNFPTSIAYWENRIHIWALIFRSQNFLVLHMFLKYRYLENGNNFKKLREVFSQKERVHKNLFQFIHRYHIFGEPNASLSPIFQQFGQIFRAKVDLTGQVRVEKWIVYFTNTWERAGWTKSIDLLKKT